MNDQCPTCTRDASNPYRRSDARGRITEGCVDECHGKHLILDAYRTWFLRPQAKQIRRTLKAMKTGTKR